MTHIAAVCCAPLATSANPGSPSSSGRPPARGWQGLRWLGWRACCDGLSKRVHPRREQVTRRTDDDKSWEAPMAEVRRRLFRLCPRPRTRYPCI